MLRALRRLLPTDQWTRALLPVALVFIAAAIDRNYQTDLWHHLARGRAIAAEGQLLNIDRFTFTVPGLSFQDSNWGWQVAFFYLHRLGGLPLVQTVNALTLALAMAVLVALCCRRSGSMAASCAACVLAFFGLWQMLIIRPQTFSLLLFVLLYAVLEAAWERRWWLVLAPLLLAVWANVHGGFPVGLVLVGCYVLAAALSPRAEEPHTDHVTRVGLGRPSVILRRVWASALAGPAEGQGAGVKGQEGDNSIRWATLVPRTAPWALCLLACAAATLANPYTWRVYQYVSRTTGTASGRRIDEWLPPGLDMLAGKVWVLSLVAMLVLCALRWRRPTRREICLVCCFLPASCGSVRMVVWWLLVSAPILAAQAAACWARGREADPAGEEPSRGAALTYALLIGAMVLALPCCEAYNPVLRIPGRAHRTESDLQAAADHLTARGRRGRVFTRFDWGEYLGWSLAGKYTVFMDGRIEIFPDEVWAEYAAVTRGRGDWEEILGRYGVDCLLLDTTGYHHDLLPLVERSPAWKQTFQKGNAVLFVRQNAPAREVAAR